MDFTLEQDMPLGQENQHHFYTDDELALLNQLEQGLVSTQTHDQVMENLRKKLGLGVSGSHRTRWDLI